MLRSVCLHNNVYIAFDTTNHQHLRDSARNATQAREHMCAAIGVIINKWW